MSDDGVFEYANSAHNVPVVEAGGGFASVPPPSEAVAPPPEPVALTQAREQVAADIPPGIAAERAADPASPFHESTATEVGEMIIPRSDRGPLTIDGVSFTREQVDAHLHEFGMIASVDLAIPKDTIRQILNTHAHTTPEEKQQWAATCARELTQEYGSAASVEEKLALVRAMILDPDPRVRDFLDGTFLGSEITTVRALIAAAHSIAASGRRARK